MNSVRTSGPLAFSGTRLGWADLPRAVRSRISELAGAQVVIETSATSGFSPGFAAVLELGDGTEVFVKAVSAEQNADSPVLARAEMRVAQHLPRSVPAPRLRWADDDGTWVLLGFDAVHGQSPEQPWRPDELDRVLQAVTGLAETQAPAAAGLRPLSSYVAALSTGWARLAQDDGALVRAESASGPHGAWIRSHLGPLQEWSAQAVDACSGDSLVHGDLRADNVILGPDTVWLIDWPHASSLGAPWFDLLGMLPSVAMQGGGDPAEIFWSQPTTDGADPEAVRAVLAAVAGYFLHASVQPAPHGISNLRAFQLAQAVPAVDWLRRF